MLKQNNLETPPQSFLSEAHTLVYLTEKAAQMVKEAMRSEQVEGYGLRVGVIGGGCSGLQYSLDFTEKPGDLDFVLEQHNISVFIDPFSAAHLDGTTIDYVEEGLHKTGFKFGNPNASRTCGCGSSFRT